MPEGALDPFFDALVKVDDGSLEFADKVRVVHLGDSSIGVDDLTHAIRRRMQARFGAGGPGFIAVQRHSINYRPRLVKLQPDFGWSECYIANKCADDGLYGLGGVSFTSGGGARSTLTLRGDSDPVNETHRVELWYLEHPRGGRMSLRVDEAEPLVVESRSEQAKSAWVETTSEAPVRQVEIRAKGHGKSRAYGVVLESAASGLTWEGMSMIGAFTQRMLEWDAEHIREQIDHRDPDLLVLSFGGNDLRRVVASRYRGGRFSEDFRAAIDRVRGPEGPPCLVTGVHDHARIGQYDVEPWHVEEIVDAQREVALAAGCAFFDQYRAMGGGGGLKRWRREKPPHAEPDLKHLNHRGRERMGGWIVEALLAEYVAYRLGEPSPSAAASEAAASADEG